MGDVILKDGRAVSINVSEMTVAEWRKFATPSGTVKDEDAVISKCSGLTPEEIAAMPFQDFRKVVRAIVKACQEPLSDPN